MVMTTERGGLVQIKKHNGISGADGCWWIQVVLSRSLRVKRKCLCHQLNNTREPAPDLHICRTKATFLDNIGNINRVLSIATARVMARGGKWCCVNGW